MTDGWIVNTILYFIFLMNLQNYTYLLLRVIYTRV